MPCRRDCLQTCAIILLHNGVWSLSLKASFSTSLSTASRRCWRGYTLSFIDFKTTWVKGLNQLTEMDEDRKRQVDSLPSNATVVNNYNAEVPVRGHAVVPELQHLYAASRSPNTHLAENRLSTDFCDWSEVTDGLLWETWRQKGRVRRGKEGEKKRSSGIFLWLFPFSSQHACHVIKKWNTPTEMWQWHRRTVLCGWSASRRVCVCVCAFGGCSLCFWKKPRRRVSIQATKLYRLLSPLTKTGTKMSIISCFTFWNNTTVSPGKINKGASCILKVFRGGKWMTCSKCTDRLMWCSYPLWSYTSPSRRRRGCCTERRHPPHLRQSERLIFTKHLTRCCRL